ncbi:MAG: hypothetical protein ACOC38_03795, partial [Promethearchaeia archaeon]
IDLRKLPEKAEYVNLLSRVFIGAALSSVTEATRSRSGASSIGSCSCTFAEHQVWFQIQI